MTLYSYIGLKGDPRKQSGSHLQGYEPLITQVHEGNLKDNQSDDHHDNYHGEWSSQKCEHMIHDIAVQILDPRR